LKPVTLLAESGCACAAVLQPAQLRGARTLQLAHHIDEPPEALSSAGSSSGERHLRITLADPAFSATTRCVSMVAQQLTEARNLVGLVEGGSLRSDGPLEPGGQHRSVGVPCSPARVW